MTKIFTDMVISWLREIAMNNVDSNREMTFLDAVEDIRDRAVYGLRQYFEDNLDGFFDGIQKQKVVRCKDCKHRFDGCCYNKKSNRISYGIYVADNWFCADGEIANDDA